MSYLVDTNILVYSMDTASPFHISARKLVEKCAHSTERWCFTWVNIFEYLRVVTHPGIFKKPLKPAEAQKDIRQFLSLPQTEVLTEDLNFFQVYQEITADLSVIRGNLVHDAHIAALMKLHGIKKIFTLDKQFGLFPFLDIVEL